MEKQFGINFLQFRDNDETAIIMNLDKVTNGGFVCYLSEAGIVAK